MFLSLLPGAVVIQSDDVWPMVRIYRGGFLLIQFLFLLGTLKDTDKYTHYDDKFCSGA